MSEAADHGARIGRVEVEVQNLNLGFVDLKADVKGLGSILGRIERGIEQAQDRSAEREQLAKPNVTAMISILITMISIIVGGAWIIGGSLARQDERSEWVKGQLERQESRIWEERNRIRPPTQLQLPVAQNRGIRQVQPTE